MRLCMNPSSENIVDVALAQKKEDGIRTQIYQGTLLNKGLAFSINVVVILKTNLATHKQAHVILLGTDLKLPYEKL
jgi:hypothetical protein